MIVVTWAALNSDASLTEPEPMATRMFKPEGRDSNDTSHAVESPRRLRHSEKTPCQLVEFPEESYMTSRLICEMRSRPTRKHGRHGKA